MLGDVRQPVHRALLAAVGLLFLSDFSGEGAEYLLDFIGKKVGFVVELVRFLG